MVDRIYEYQYQDLLDAYSEGRTSDIVKTFADLTGIVVKPYTGYQFFDAAGNYLGDDNFDSISDILKNAYIEVVDDGE